MIDTNLFCPEGDPVIYGEFFRSETRAFSSREGPPPTCVDPIVPTQADLEGRADLLVQLVRSGQLGAGEALYLFPDNVRGNPEAELTVQACCFGAAQLPGPPPSTPLDPGPEETNEALSQLALILPRTDAGISPPPTVYEDPGMPVEESVNAQTEVKQDKAPHAEVIKMVEKAVLIVTTAISNIFGVSATGDPNAQEVVGTVTVAGPFPWVEVTGDLMDDGTFVAAGKGTVAGFPNIAVSFAGTLTPGGIVGDYTMGAEGGLPQAEPIIFGVEGRLEEWDTFFDELSAVFLEAAEAAAGVNFEAPLLEAVRASALGNPFTTVSAADFTGPVAPESIVSGFGVTGAVFDVAQMVPLPTNLGGVSIRVTDSEGADSPAAFFFSSNLQSNFLIPAGAALGDAVLTVFQGDQILATGSVRIEPIAPTLFAANANGMGVAAARFLLVLADNSRVEDFIFDPNLPEGSRTALPIDLSGEGELVFLLLFGTGIRGSTSGVTATVDGVAVPVLGAVEHPIFVGLDQVNIGPIPLSLIGAGEVEIILFVDGIPTNTLTVSFL